MSVDYSARLMYGTDYTELEDAVDGLGDLVADGDLDCASPFYDSPRDSWFVGVAVEVSGLESDAVEAIRAAREQFERVCGGLPGRLRVCLNVT